VRFLGFGGAKKVITSGNKFLFGLKNIKYLETAKSTLQLGVLQLPMLSLERKGKKRFFAVIGSSLLLPVPTKYIFTELEFFKSLWGLTTEEE
jgi:hypothetical protein